MLKQTVKHLSNVKEVEPPHWMSTRIMARIREEGRKKTFPFSTGMPWFSTLIKVVPVLFLVVIGFLVYRSIEPSGVGVTEPASQEQTVLREEFESVKEEPRSLPETKVTDKILRKEKDEGMESGDASSRAVPASPAPAKIPAEKVPAAAPVHDRSLEMKKAEEAMAPGEGRSVTPNEAEVGKQRARLFMAQDLEDQGMYHITLKTLKKEEDIAEMLSGMGIARSDFEIKKDGTIQVKGSLNRIKDIIDELKKAGDIISSDDIRDISQENILLEIKLIRPEG